MKKISPKMLRLLDDGYLVFSKNNSHGYDYHGQWPLEDERHDSLFFSGTDLYVCKYSDLQELRTMAEFFGLDKVDKVLVTRVHKGNIVGVVMYPSELALDVATWNALRVWRIPDA